VKEGAGTEEGRTTSGIWSRLESSSWSWMDVFGWTSPPLFVIAQ
jgi:hypothetical protein